MKLLSFPCLLLLSLLVLSIPLMHSPSLQRGLAMAQGDDESEVGVETDDEVDEGVYEERPDTRTAPDEEDSDFDDDEDEDSLKKAPGVETYMILTSHPEYEITAGDSAVALVGFYNGANEELFIHSIHGSLRHPQDMSHIIENFTILSIDQYVLPEDRTAYDFEFTVGELYLPRPYGLMIEVRYKSVKEDNEVEFGHAVYNNTVKLLEVVELFDTETFFMYVFMVTGMIILAFIIHYVWSLTSSGRKHQAKAAKKAQQSSAQVLAQNEADNSAGVDYSWVSPGAMQGMGKKSPRSPKSKRNVK